MTRNEFELRRQQAVEHMRQMNARSTQQAPEPQKLPEPQSHYESKPPKSSGLDIPFLNFLSSDKDAALIIGLLLILMSEKSDKTLLFALVYILL